MSEDLVKENMTKKKLHFESWHFDIQTIKNIVNHILKTIQCAVKRWVDDLIIKLIITFY